MSLQNVEKADITGSGKGAQGWFPVRQANIRYDRPSHASLDYALAIDFANEERGPDARVAVELSSESARELTSKIHAILGISEEYQGPVEPEMCSGIIEKAEMNGSGEGPQGWFPLHEAHVYFDQPFHSSLDLALIIDFLNEEQGLGGRLSVEMSAESARAVTQGIQAALG
jgi:hypothetical protein